MLPMGELAEPEMGGMERVERYFSRIGTPTWQTGAWGGMMAEGWREERVAGRWNKVKMERVQNIMHVHYWSRHLRINWKYKSKQWQTLCTDDLITKMGAIRAWSSNNMHATVGQGSELLYRAGLYGWSVKGAVNGVKGSHLHSVCASVDVSKPLGCLISHRKCVPVDSHLPIRIKVYYIIAHYNQILWRRWPSGSLDSPTGQWTPAGPLRWQPPAASFFDLPLPTKVCLHSEVENNCHQYCSYRFNTLLYHANKYISNVWATYAL